MANRNTTTSFAGTSLAAEHIGNDPSRRAAALLKDDDYTPVVPVIEVGAEASNAIPFSIQLQDADGKPLAKSVLLKCEARDAAMLVSASNLTLAATTGTEVSTTAKGTLLVQTNASGQAVVVMTDVSAVLVADVFLEVTPADRLGAKAIEGATFA